MSQTVPLRPLAFAALLLGVATFGSPAPPEQISVRIPTTLADPRLSELRRASVGWDLRAGPPRQVVDQVCLVPDVATFYEALATWDDGHYFPILIDDVDLCLKFLRAFRPARVVRYPRRGKPIEGNDAWDRAVAAVGDAWSAEGAGVEQRVRGDARPAALGKTPPGVVIARPSSETLPGLAALAAGRFQPLIRVDSPKAFKDALSAEEFQSFSDAIETAIRAKLPNHGMIGDDCDFITLAGDYPYRYTSPKRSTGSITAVHTDPPGMRAVDDGLARSGPTLRRWAFAGRLMGDPRRSVYAAMCSLFLRPERALLFNGYPETEQPFSLYTLKPASDRLRSTLPTKLLAGDKATLLAWHEAADPSSRYGLALINSKGGPTYFDLPGGTAHTMDVMPSLPAAVCMIHSYSAADPTDPGTIAGRWLAQGAFLYYGSMDEPYLNSFRTPTLVSDLMAEGLPFGAALRPLSFELFGDPWKLVLLGDPLYKLQARNAAAPRAREFRPSSSWIAYSEPAPPPPDAPESSRLVWSVNAALVRQTSGAIGGIEQVLAVARSIDRGRLDPAAREVLDSLILILLYESGRLDEVRAFYRAIPTSERTAASTRLASSAAVAEFYRGLAGRNLDRAGGPWIDLLRLVPDEGFKSQLTARMGALADTPSRREAWRRLLRQADSRLDRSEAGKAVAEELKRVEKAMAPGPGR